MDTTKPTSLYTALLAFQRAVGPVKKDASNPAFRTKYATLQSVLETVEEPLSDNGLVLLQRFETDDTGRMLLVTEIAHAESGQRVASVAPVVSKDPTDPQKMGGAITYYRRYSLLALLGLAPEDDDGNAASKPAPPRQQQRDTNTPVAGGFVVTPDGQPRPAPASTGTPAPAANGARPPTSPAITRDADWTDVWSTARPMGIKDRAALDLWLGGDGAQGLAPWQILARLKEAAAPAAPPSH